MHGTALADNAEVDFNIKSQELGAALNEFALQSGKEILFVESELAGISAPDVSGTYKPTIALDLLLADARLDYRINKLDTVLVGVVAEGGSGELGKIQPALSHVLMAQNQTPATQTQVSRTNNRNGEEETRGARNRGTLEEIVVTGSRLTRTSADTPTPTTAVSAAIIDMSGATNSGELLNFLPSIADSTGRRTNATIAGRSSAQSVGAELPNLRGLGTIRTLTLVNGRRRVGNQAGNTAVDVNTIPQNMIERVEIITGASSAVYGADAVSGAINFILKDEFDGFEASLNYGVSDRSDGQKEQFGLLFGSDFAGERGHLVLGLTLDSRDSIPASNRALAGSDLDFFDTGGGNPGNIVVEGRTFVPLDTAGIAFGTDGFLSPLGSLGVLVFNDDGTARPFDTGACDRQGRCTGPDGYPQDIFALISTPQDRILANGLFRYRLTDSHELFGEISFSDTDGFGTGPSFIHAAPFFGVNLTFTTDNAFLDPGLAADLESEGITEFAFNKGFEDLDPGAPIRNSFETTQATLGLRGSLNDRWQYEAYAQFGRSTAEITDSDFLIDEFVNALDTIIDPQSGLPVCRDPAARAAGCVPLNPFGRVASSREAREALVFSSGTNTELKQTVLTGFVTGELVDLPAGPLSVVGGLEYREEESSSVPDKVLRTPGLTHRNTDEFSGDTAFQSTAGEYDVTEVFAEVLVPLLADLPFIQQLNLEAAGRYSDYSTVGTTSTYRAALDWAISDSFRIRASGGRSIRAPNIAELFRPESVESQFVDDPCSDAQLAIRPERTARCIEEGKPAPFISFADIAVVPILVQGNGGLDAEESDAQAFGIVFSPTFLQGLSLTVDYWNIEIDKAIDVFDADTLLDNCVDLPAGNQACGLITRNPQTFQIEQIQQQSINVNKFESSGVDIEARYGFDLGPGALDFTMYATNVIKRRSFPDPVNPELFIEDIGDLNDPEWRVTLFTRYSLNNLGVQLGARYVGDTVHGNRDLPGEFSVDRIGSVTYADLFASYVINDHYRVSLGISNLFDRDPPRVPVLYQGTNLYDSIGRFYTLGLQFQL